MMHGTINIKYIMLVRTVLKYSIGSSYNFSALPHWSWGSTSLLYNGYRVFPGGKIRPGRTVDHSPSYSAALMEE